jgi:hypothetical protein
MKKDRYKIWMTEKIKQSIKENRSYVDKSFENADKIIIWLVGFSIAAIGLVLRYKKDLSEYEDLLNRVILFSCLTVIFGILYRIMKFLSDNLEALIFLVFSFEVESFNINQVLKGRSIIKEDSSEDIIKYIESDFEVTLDKTKIENKDELSFRKSLIQYYSDLDDKDLKRQIAEMDNISNKYFAQKENKWNEKDIKFKAKKQRFYFKSSMLLFSLSCLSFIMIMILIILND